MKGGRLESSWGIVARELPRICCSILKSLLTWLATGLVFIVTGLYFFLIWTPLHFGLVMV